MFEVVFDKAVTANMTKMEKKLVVRIFKKIESAKQNPMQYFFRLTGRTDYRMRVGDWRVIADIDYKNRRIMVTNVGHRKKIYET